MFYGVEYLSGQFGSAVLAVFPPHSFLCNSLLAEHETQRRPRKHHMTDGLVVATNIILTLNPKPSTVLATERKINSIPSKTRTVSEAPAHGE